MTVATNRRKRTQRGRPGFEFDDRQSERVFHRIGQVVRARRGEGTPLWSLVKDELVGAIRTGKLKPESRLPSEQALCDLFDVSRPVVRSAIRALSDDGLVLRLPRKGMYVAPVRAIADFPSSNLSVFGDMTAKGHKVDTLTLEFGRRNPNEREREVFGIGKTGSVIHIRRIYLIDDRPLTFTRISLPGHRVPDMEKLDIDHRSLYETMRLHYGIEVCHAERWFTAGPATEEVSADMGISLGVPMIIIDSIAYDQYGRPIEMYHSYYDSNVARIHTAV